jgi:hypothetical protein
MDLADLRVLTRTYLDEDAATVDKFWSDAQVDTAINVGVRRTHNRIKNVSRWHFTTRATCVTESGIEYYELPANLKDLKIVSYEDEMAKEKYLIRDTGPNMFDWQHTGVITPAGTGIMSSYPQAYWIVGSTIRIVPVPQAVWTLRMYYEARITDLTSGPDTPAFDEDYHDMAAKWAALELMPKNQDNEVGKMVAALLQDRDRELVQDVLHRLPEPYTRTVAYLQGW